MRVCRCLIVEIHWVGGLRIRCLRSLLQLHIQSTLCTNKFGASRKTRPTTTLPIPSPMARLLSADAVLRGRLSSYTIGKELHRAADDGAVYLARSVQSPSHPASLPSDQLDSIN